MTKKLILLLFICLLPLSAFSAGLDANTNLLMHMDGADDGTTFSDSSITSNKGNATVTATVQTKTATKKWGTASALFDGDSGYLTYADSADWDLLGSNSDNWTIDMQIKFTDHSGTDFVFEQSEDDSNGYFFYHYDGGGFAFYMTAGGSQDITLVGGEITDTNWHHVALIKVGNTYGVYLDGTQTSYDSDNSTDTYGAALNIGAKRGATFYDGYMDELRIQHNNYFEAAPVVGLTDTITVPTEAYGVSAVGQIIIISMM